MSRNSLKTRDRLTPHRTGTRTVKTSKGKSKGMFVVDNQGDEAALVALRRALLEEYPDRNCWIQAPDLDIVRRGEQRAEGSVIVRSIDHKSPKRAAPPIRLNFIVNWENGADDFGLPTTHCTSYELTPQEI